jgi:hypothetical protein
VIETAKRVSMSRYAAIYVAILVGSAALVFVSAILFPELIRAYGKHTSIPTRFVAAMVAYQTFIRERSRLLNREEYWEVVAYCAVLTFAWETFWFSVRLFFREIPTGSAAAALLIFMLIAALMSCAIPMFGFSNWMGNTFLKAELKRRAIAASRG